ncbi:NnrS protein involved in response to NO [hydrothermal vent metagenome]|uniref:NnrS protein involved in response to NO n=1 Tax=hydrothermal vent metagenome TaxID=652676 RepID=A0A1W1BNK5_9ZZZZ
MINITDKNKPNLFPFLNLGFRPFFFAAGLSSSLLMFLWLIIYQFNIITIHNLTPQYWHAHEMIFGFTIAVISGFLLTAVRNWTGQQTIHGIPLLLLFLLWIVARIIFFIPNVSLVIQATIDSSFLLFITFFIALPIIKTKSWSNIGIVAKVLLLAISHIIFYLGLLGILKNGIIWGLYGAFYTILALIFVMARRVVPFFIEKGLGLKKELKNPKWLDISSLILFVLYVFFEIFWQSKITFLLAFLLFLLHSYRLINWHHKNIWRKPLLWSLYLAYVFLTLGFALKSISFFINISPYIVIHSFTMGIGLITLAMMSRVALGHTARNVFQPPKILFLIFTLSGLTFIFRVILPLLLTQHYFVWILISQILWLSAFVFFTITYTPMLFKKRLDNQFG